MMNEQELVLSAYYLWRDDFVSEDIYADTMHRIRAEFEPITKGQIDFLNKLKADGKVPSNLNINNFKKIEASAIIKESLAKPVNPPIKMEVTTQSPKPLFTPTMPEDLEKMMDTSKDELYS